MADLPNIPDKADTTTSNEHALLSDHVFLLYNRQLLLNGNFIGTKYHLQDVSI